VLTSSILILAFPHSFSNWFLHTGVAWASAHLPCVESGQPIIVYLFL
jgi:hypothetical protein